MNESSVTRALIARLKVLLRGAVILKHSDRFTAGIPDMSVSWGGATFWLELKKLGDKEDPFSSRGVKPVQRAYLAALFAATNGKAFVVVYRPKGRVDCYRPDGSLALSNTGHDTVLDLININLGGDRA